MLSEHKHFNLILHHRVIKKFKEEKILKHHHELNAVLSCIVMLLSSSPFEYQE